MFVISFPCERFLLRYERWERLLRRFCGGARGKWLLLATTPIPAPLPKMNSQAHTPPKSYISHYHRELIITSRSLMKRHFSSRATNSKLIKDTASAGCYFFHNQAQDISLGDFGSSERRLLSCYQSLLLLKSWHGNAWPLITKRQQFNKYFTPFTDIRLL